MTLRELIQDVPYVVETRGNLDMPIGQITGNSRERSNRDFFAVIPALGLMLTSLRLRRWKTAALH